MIDDTKIHEIQRILTRLIEAVRNNRDLDDFDTVEIPFQLTQACLQLWTDCFSLPMLQNLADHDSETLEAWAIALNMTLQAQLGILNQWTPLLSAGYIPPKLREKMEHRTHELDNIANVKSKLLQSAANLLAQEAELRNASIELLALRTKINELQNIKLDLEATNLVKLRDEYNQQWERLQQIRVTSKQYMTETEAIRAELDTHYQVNLALGKALPVARNQWEALTKSIQEQLIKLDHELQTAFTQHERLHKIKHIDFSSKS